MMAKIDKLTPEQEEQLIAYREACRQSALATGPANLEAIRPTINDFYNRIGKEPPYLWRCESPLMANRVINALRNMPSLIRNLSSELSQGKADNLLGGDLCNDLDHEGRKLRTSTWENINDGMMHGIIERSVDGFTRKVTDNNFTASDLRDLRNAILENLKSSLQATGKDNSHNALWADAVFHLRSDADETLRDKLPSETGEKLYSNLRSNLWANIGHIVSSLDNSLEDSAGSNNGNLDDGQSEPPLADTFGSILDHLSDNISEIFGLIDDDGRNKPGINIYENIGTEANDDVWDGLLLNLREILRVGLQDILDSSMRDSLAIGLQGKMEDSIEDEITEKLDNSLWDGLLNNLWLIAKESVADSVEDALHEELDASGTQNNLDNNLEDSIRCDILSALIYGMGENLRPILGDRLRAILRSSLETSFVSAIKDARGTYNNLSENIQSEVISTLWDSLLDVLSSFLVSGLIDSMELGLKSGSSEYVGTYLWGSLDMYWIAYYMFPHEYLRPMHTDDQMHLLKGWKNIAENAFWWYPFDGVCFVCDRPTEYHFDDQWRLHNPDGMAVKFSDGWGVHSVHGVQLPAWIIENPETITVEKITVERNIEIKRVMIDKYGQEKYLVDVGAEIVHSDGYGDLYRAEIDGDEPLVMIKVVNCTPEPDGTYRDFFVRVPPNMTTAEQAWAWTESLEPGTFEIVQQT